MKSNQKISQKEFIILGLLQEGPAHGYDLEAKIKDRGIRNWTAIGFSSIYHLLKKLEGAGFIDREQRIVNGKAQQVFHLTDTGHAELNRLIETALTRTRGNRGDFSVAISNTVDWSANKIQGLLRQRIANLKDDYSNLQIVRAEKLRTGMPDFPAIMILFDKPLAQIRAEIDFFNQYINKFNRGT